MASSVLLRCVLCPLPWAWVEGDRLYVRSRHNHHAGTEPHVNSISVAELARLVAGAVGSQLCPTCNHEDGEEQHEAVP